jgi:prevent-host-death family protein
MRDTYSLYEAKAKLSAIIRRVREGHHVLVTLHGEPVAEIRPLASPATGIDARLNELADRGVLVRPARDAPLPKMVVRKPGALARFLADRNE